jgi:hypothetical protein
LDGILGRGIRTSGCENKGFDSEDERIVVRTALNNVEKKTEKAV